MHKFMRYALALLLVAGFSLGVVYPAVTHSIEKVSSINGRAGGFNWDGNGPVKIEDVVTCANGDAWAIGIGPGSFDDAVMFRVTGMNTGNPKVAGFIGFADPSLGLDEMSIYPAGMGPRGYPGLTVSFDCSTAYYGNFFGGSVVSVNLSKGTLNWPANFVADETTGLFTADSRVLGAPVDVQTNGIADTRLYVGDSDGSIVVMNAKTGKVLATYKTSGIGPGSVVAGGDAWVAAVQNRGGISCIDLASGKEAKLAAKSLTNPFMMVASSDLGRLYVSNQGANSVSVLSGGGCAKSVVKDISVGNAPRHMALSPDNQFLYVSNSTDNTISVIDTGSLSVVATIEVATSDPAPIGHVVVSNNNRYVYVFYEGGPRSAQGTFQFIGYNVESLY